VNETTVLQILIMNLSYMMYKLICNSVQSKT